jgi:hypothetical protein
MQAGVGILEERTVAAATVEEEGDELPNSFDQDRPE